MTQSSSMFDRLPERSHTSLWNVMSKGYLQNHAYNDVMVLFADMRRENVNPNCYTLPVVLKSCCKAFALREGEQVHSVAIKTGFKSNTYVGTNLIEFYSGGGHVTRAYRVFTEMVLRNVVSWTAMINGYVANGDLVSAKRLFDLAPERDVVLWSRIVSAHAEAGDMVEAKRLFDLMPGKDLMSYNTLLNGYANNGDPNDATLVSVLAACARLGSLDFGKWVHKYAERSGYKGNVYVCNGLMDMYAKCGLVECSIDVFNSMDKKDLISWNTIINALAVHGHGADALEIFGEMKSSGEKPDGITFIGILCACSHMGLVKDGLDHFHSMRDEHSIEPQIEHYGCVVDLLARGGLLEQALEFIRKMPMEADGVVWTALLAASRVHKKIEFAELSLKKLIEIDRENPANYVMLSNVYGEARKWEDLARLKVAMRDTGSKKVPGLSSIQTDDEIGVMC
ncbi:hypothetical protein MIMGU_mgv1a006248mg [Erythranthe guttata]|uniref:Pentacotripeptide-repeat region of PRORP domain-containing protein n=1 Tax=Erythranthe guttata TaxID=4155 RepID=A0A022RPA3_ERYGU|nr:hypothetical protein MIMGU_mgv1a006248mg [Erythranthe guttata]